MVNVREKKKKKKKKKKKDFDEFVNLHDILFVKSSLWSLMVIYDSLSYILCGRLLKVVLLLTLFRY